MDASLVDVESLVYRPHIKKKKLDAVRIAIVEDDPMFRHAVEYFLKKNPDNRVFSFASGEECLQHYHSLDPEILILDYKLNEVFESERMNGLDILRKIKSFKPETEIIFLSGQDSFEIATTAIKDGASEYIVKDDKALQKMLNEVNKRSFFIRTRREELRTMRWTIALTAFVTFLLVAAYYTGYDRFTGLLNVLIIAGASSCALVLLLLFRKKKREKMSTKTSPQKEERSGHWLD
ncbi:MAG: response regulator transcription factor [Bacteroidota bacterium]|nr:response regulator transcription factor [Bacteroidota bacterium]